MPDSHQPSRAPTALRIGAAFAAGAALNLIFGTAGARYLFTRGFDPAWFALLGWATAALEGAVGGMAIGGGWPALEFAVAFALRPALYDVLAGFTFAIGASLAPHHHAAAEFVRGAAGGALILGIAGAIAAALVSRRLRVTLDGLWTFALGGALRSVAASALVRSIMRGARILTGAGAAVVGIGGPALASFIAGALFALRYSADTRERAHQ